ncbi:hypothetical protein [Ornithinimicrobium kibberense]|uniref:hypothetical protein n=1 Tax=Ornithinimicrobium kibberense TaxID=282060 RepID=UPI00360DF315
MASSPPIHGRSPVSSAYPLVHEYRPRIGGALAIADVPRARRGHRLQGLLKVCTRE